MIDMTAVRELMSRFTPTRSISCKKKEGHTVLLVRPADIVV